MTLTERQLELLKEIYDHYTLTNEFLERQAFRDSHEPDDMELLNQLEYSLNYLKGDNGQNGGRYKFDPILFLASPYGEKELELAFEVAKTCQSLYPKYKQNPIFFSEFKNLFKLPETALRRALGYLSERNFLYFGNRDTYEVVTFQESIRALKTKGQIVTPYAKTKWLEDTGARPRPTFEKGHMPPGLIEPQLVAAIPSPAPANDAFLIDWMENLVLQRIILRNHQEAKKNAGAGAYKSALIMVSSCIEGVLLAALEKENAANSPAAKKIAEALKKKAAGSGRESVTLMELDLRNLISLTGAIELIHSQHTALSNVAAEYRNYVHPGKEARQKEIVFDKPEFDATLATLQMITRDLNQHFLKAKDS